MPRPIHFEIQADQPKRAIKFYESMFGWQFSAWPGPVEYWIPNTGRDGLVTKALGLGGEMAVPKMPIPGMGWLAYVKDTEGNTFGMMEADPKAA